MLSNMARVVTISMVRHDTDILETCLRHTVSFADTMLLRLHRPTPVLRAMAETLRAEGLPLLISESSVVHYEQEDAMNDLLTQAVTLHGADYVLPLDADEFLGGAMDLRKALLALPTDTPTALPWRTYVPTPSDDPAELHPLRRIRHRRERESPPYIKVLIPGGLVRCGNARLTMGSHALNVGGQDAPTLASSLFLAHYPVRSDRQLRTKVLCGWQSHQRNPARRPGQVFHWEGLFGRCNDRRPIDADELRHIALAYAQNDEHTQLVQDPLLITVPVPHLDVETHDPWTLLQQDAMLYAATE
jgi:hypothetical protein